MEYPVLVGAVPVRLDEGRQGWDVGPWLPGALQVVLYFNVVALGLSLAWLVTVWATALLAGRRVWDAALVAVSPLVMVHAFTNFDPLATAFAAGGLLAWARRRPVLAGVLLGLGGAAKLYPLLLLGPLLVLCLRAGRDAAVVAVPPRGAAAAWLAVNLPDRAAVPGRLAGVLPAQLRARRRPGLDLQRDHVVHRLDRFRRCPGQGETPTNLNAVSLVLFAAVLRGHRLPRPDRAAPAPAWRSCASW